MIVGIGTDIIEIERIKKAIDKNPNFINKYFTKAEQEIYRKRNKNPQTIAGNFAVKEAVSKALGTGFRGFGLIDIEVLRDPMGKPHVNLYGKAKMLQKELGMDHIFITISHCKSYAVAYVVAERNESFEDC